MGPKKVSTKGSAAKKKRMMCIELKKEIIEKHDQGVRVADLARQYVRSTSTICTVLKQKELIKAMTPAKGVKIISKQRTSIHENMEKLLMVWLTEMQLAGDTLTEAIICEKARAIYADLLRQIPGSSTDEASGEPFKASRGWFENFKKRTGIHSVAKNYEDASSDMKEAEDCLKNFTEIIAADGYIAHEVFNCNETRFLSKKKPRRTYITAEETRMPSVANASSDCKIKPIRDEGDINEHIEEHSSELTTEEIKELQTQQHTEVLQQIGDPEEEEPEEVISTSEIKEMLGMWEKLSDFIKKKHPEKVVTGHVTALFNDACLMHFRNILKSSVKQTSLDRFLSKPPAVESDGSE